MKRYYVTATWHDWPEGGSYGTVVEVYTQDLARQVDVAKKMCHMSMASIMAEDFPADEPESNPEYWLAEFADQWHIVDCFDLDEFIARHKRRPA